ncbi:hypothetical protein NFI96_002695 [Prochilodus magdalenae]|nr:hypothetical protein NFI96_002695 [Prochilodus magdalenae]
MLVTSCRVSVDQTLVPSCRAEPFEETDVDRLMSSLGFGGSHQVKGHSDSSTLSSQPSIDEVRQQMHLLLDNAFGLASAEPSTGGRHHHHHPHSHSPYNPSQSSPYSDGVTSAPGTMDHPAGALQRGSSFEPDMHQCSLPKPGFRFTQLPDMGLGSPPPLIPPRAGAPPGTSLRCSTPDMSLKPRVSEASEMSQHNGTPYLPINRAPFPAVTVDQSMSSYSGNPMTAVYAISANRPGYSDYFVLSPPSSYRSPSWMSYPPEPDDLPRQWNDTDPLQGPPQSSVTAGLRIVHQPKLSSQQCPVGSVLWGASCGERPVGSVLWAASCGQRPVGSVLWAASCGQRAVGSILWGASCGEVSCGERPVGSVLWKVSCGECPVGSVLWAASCGERPVGSVLWGASCGERPVGSVLWGASCGERPVGSVLWGASCGECPVGNVLWGASCGERPVGSVLCADPASLTLIYDFH